MHDRWKIIDFTRGVLDSVHDFLEIPTARPIEIGHLHWRYDFPGKWIEFKLEPYSVHFMKLTMKSKKKWEPVGCVKTATYERDVQEMIEDIMHGCK